MTTEERRDLSKARYERACDCLHTAEVTREIGDYRAAANRSYYAIFHSMRAVLALDEVDMSKHSGIMAEFQEALSQNRYPRQKAVRHHRTGFRGPQRQRL